MIKKIKKYDKLYEFFFLGVLTFFCFGMSIFRCVYTETNVFLFLNWNLFLAFIPWAVSSFIVINSNIQKSKLVIPILLSVWLLFFPNAPYILTDLFHLRLKTTMPIWFDLILILSFAWTGLFFGLSSLKDIEELLRKRYNSFLRHIIIILLLFIGSFGVYVGRYLRWNSWDIFTEPIILLNDLFDRFIDPFSHPRTWGLTILMGVFLNLIYWSFKMMKQKTYQTS